VTTVLAPTPRVVETPRLLDPDALSATPRRGPTLEEAVLDASRELRRRGTTACLVCGEPTDAAGDCRACGASLS
jgi:hypothetical protein